MFVTARGIVMLVRDLQSWNTPNWIEVTPSGIDTRGSDEHLLNAVKPMFVMLEDIATFVRELQPANATPPMDVTLAGIVTLVRFVQSANAHSPMRTTGFPSIADGIATSTMHEAFVPTQVFASVPEISTSAPRDGSERENWPSRQISTPSSVTEYIQVYPVSGSFQVGCLVRSGTCPA